MENESGDELMTIEEFMQNADAEEESADLVLGGGVSDECTYKEGYLPRQAVFSCLTCVPQGNAGICTACSLSCHDGHEIVELWTKRQFRCDCGNSKFGNKAECKLFKEKETENSRNGYNQNFLGFYCSCHRRYPVPEDQELGEMFQCVICEDWLHETHLGLPPSEKIPRDEEGDPAFDELICPACVERCGFLSSYWTQHIEPKQENIQADPTEGIPAAVNGHVENGGVVPTEKEGDAQVEPNGQENIPTTEVKTSEGKVEPVENGTATDQAGCSELAKPMTCKLKNDSPNGKHLRENMAVFLDKNWRDELCRCESCGQVYESKGLKFLMDNRDTMQNYHAMAKEKRLTKLQNAEGAGLKFFQNMNHVAKMEFLHGVNDMTTELNTFLTSYQNSGKTVSSDDVYEFFEQLKKKRRRIV